ncbi:MBL fold metallo-hydrolase [Pseudoxanthomonas winnipegensis]|uniref:MBL fold metallo-hydrolase n=1 Tax=Pseudoxanthomonas winnipegensis TaxID=2480810 RepID=A0ABY1WJT4_9GAMM|nr:MBL fold metallo-hydrolase [Pseudoxanthomonas winnipegensis]TAA09608.1 MBL fold metallo-hydrolase [Pseudoxanthomonas winnipegensis]TAA23015.1 MBL fold metallo-hydrolase [Pseudoxanthomonas winnipegensis]TAH73425.1 MBL fold metallo-hydrolase [Pseudoxanthomonas winnipegensis]
MTDFYEIDFLPVEAKDSGDAIALRYSTDGREIIQVVDCGFKNTGAKLLEHIDAHYGKNARINFVVLTHPDRDHALGLQEVLESGRVDHLIMNRPWMFSEEIIGRTTFKTADSLAVRLRDEFPHSAALEEIAYRKGVPIYDGFQGTSFGNFKIFAPTKQHYLNLVLEAAEVRIKSLLESLLDGVKAPATQKSHDEFSAWGVENFSQGETTARNEMSIVQGATICGKKILLTGDAGRKTLTEAIRYAPSQGFALPGMDVFQVPHHGSRRNVNTEILDQLLGPILSGPSTPSKFKAFVSSAKADLDHPRKSVIRAIHHRGGSVISTEGRSIRTSQNAPSRATWITVEPDAYPLKQEVD